VSVDGTWQMVVDSPMGKQQVQLDLKTEGDQLTGTVTNKSNNMTTDVVDGKVDGDNLTWKAKMAKFNVTLTFNTTVSDDTMTGKVKAGMFGSFNVNGTRD
jgi:hypothetical protein